MQFVVELENRNPHYSTGWTQHEHEHERKNDEKLPIITTKYEMDL